MSDRMPRSSSPSRAPPEPVVAPPRRVRSDQLLGGANELVIEHQGREYRLRVTQNGKLILTA
jgi:hemin uptake protein HemP